MTPHRRRLLAVDDPLEIAPEPAAPAARDDGSRALYVRLPRQEFDDLARAAFELHTHKRALVGALISRYVDPHTLDGLATLRELLIDDEARSATVVAPDRTQAR